MGLPWVTQRSLMGFTCLSMGHTWVAHLSPMRLQYSRKGHHGLPMVFGGYGRGSQWITHEFGALVHRSSMDHPWVPRGSPMDRPWVSDGSSIPF